MASWVDLLASVTGAFFLYKWFNFQHTRAKLAHIPTLGSDWFILSYLDAWRFVFKGHFIIEEGYSKYKGQTFKVACHTTESGWLVVISGLEMVEDMRKAPADVLSFRGASLDLIQTRHTSPNNFKATPFHIPVVRSPLTRTFPGRFADVTDEIRVSCDDWFRAGYVDPDFHSWLLGLMEPSTGRNPEYLNIQEMWTIQIAVAANLLCITPDWLKPIVGRLMPGHASEKRAKQILAPLIQKRLAKHVALGGNWEGKPNDLITWLIDNASPEDLNLDVINAKVMLINFASIHTTSLTSTNTLFDLAARPEYIAPLRAEIEEVVAAHGWTKDAMARLVKLDSFMKESSRLGGVATMAMRRKAYKDFVFSNGMVIPQGMSVCVASGPIQLDSDYYEDPMEFRGFRFVELRGKEAAGLESLQHQMVSLDPTYMLFGYGRNACPGRFFAVNEVKALLAHIILNYDFKIPGDSRVVPEPIWFSGGRNSNPTAEILFRKRK
ncbi:cytochrome P450 [Coprinellus micaceus]|uniref:Cytochrome P450 n=1 Tax=Coprinellus micaceus TaxID=71717 RepID=A0A4Y7SE23_COPMI|nr:cytochrome P450 [Coprinellus micaceus]